MRRWMKTAGAAVAATMVVSAVAVAGPSRPSAPGEAPPPVKDCTRFNGHFGFYGNPWCTPEEQLRWDKWQAEYLRSRTAGSLTRP
ncbi:hypothetical protein [Hyphomicrobium sp.]|uniref:hypothetical protein n=1 Tax=Hyphomicrobium sp. TaxID=82 RepID=UPI002FE197EB